jgi:hypothetical protein
MVVQSKMRAIAVIEAERAMVVGSIAMVTTRIAAVPM